MIDERGLSVARSEVLRSLLRAWAAGDDSAFLRAAQTLVDDERRKGHALLADGLEHSLRDPRRPGASGPLALRPLPKGRDERPLLTLSKPRNDLDDLVLPTSAVDQVASFLREQHHRGLLAGHAMKPRQRLLLVGPPGTGKSATAHAIAADLSLPVATANLASLTSSLLGETGRNLESVVRFAESTPCVLLLDEFDSLATERSAPGDHGELRRVVAAILQLLDDLTGESIVVATSNHATMLDTAMWRRFDDLIYLGLPDGKQVMRLIELKTRALPGQFDKRKWAAKLDGLTPAEIEGICHDAMRLAVLDGSAALRAQHLQDAEARHLLRAAARSGTGEARLGGGLPQDDGVRP